MTIAGLYNLEHLEQVKKTVEAIDERAFVYHIEEVSDGYYNVETMKGGATHVHAVHVKNGTVDVY
jgi:hypothetical protein